VDNQPCLNANGDRLGIGIHEHPTHPGMYRRPISSHRAIKTEVGEDPAPTLVISRGKRSTPGGLELMIPNVTVGAA
jgi:hypothetical protein